MSKGFLDLGGSPEAEGGSGKEASPGGSGSLLPMGVTDEEAGPIETPLPNGLNPLDDRPVLLGGRGGLLGL